MLRTTAGLCLNGTHALSRLDATLHDFIQTYLETEYGKHFTRSTSYSLTEFRFVSDGYKEGKYSMHCVVRVKVLPLEEEIATLTLIFSVGDDNAVGKKRLQLDERNM